MILIIILSVVLLLLIAHLLILPLSKKRPIFIKGLEGLFFILIFLAVIATIIHPLLYVFAIIAGVLIYFTNSWIVYGVSQENINSALEKAIFVSRATSVKIISGYQVDNNMSVKINSLGFKMCYIQYKNKTNSKKAELTKDIFRKFIQNYYI